MGQAQNCTTRGTGSDTHTGPTWKPASTARGEAPANPRPSHPAGPRTERGQATQLHCFSQQRGRPQGRHGALWSVLFFPIREAKQREEAERPRRESGSSGPGTTTLMGTPGPRGEKRPPHPAGRGNPSSGKTAFLHPPPSQKRAPLFQSRRCCVTPPPPPRSLPDARQEQGTAPTGGVPPVAQKHCAQGNVLRGEKLCLKMQCKR